LNNLIEHANKARDVFMLKKETFQFVLKGSDLCRLRDANQINTALEYLCEVNVVTKQIKIIGEYK